MTSARDTMATNSNSDGRAREPQAGVRGGALAARIIVAAVLGAQIVALLLVGTYARRDPRLGGLPFFYWYTLLWLPVGAITMAACVWLLGRFPAHPDQRAAQATRPGRPGPACRLGEHPHHDRAVLAEQRGRDAADGQDR
ncbi:DUF3311 domain-containing protein [Candidatus Frankia nodulisporulans]|uniref:DUF3311 domain-containing protein n=1 Tax=Candidatus Frankia nodulisporulans TaxID=2060052 RepID=UPI0013D8E00F|nr:DUF3311 domain-containing protein [Candidatus Frankia nodulisporulans]